MRRSSCCTLTPPKEQSSSEEVHLYHGSHSFSHYPQVVAISESSSAFLASDLSHLLQPLHEPAVIARWSQMDINHETLHPLPRYAAHKSCEQNQWQRAAALTGVWITDGHANWALTACPRLPDHHPQDTPVKPSKHPQKTCSGRAPTHHQIPQRSNHDPLTPKKNP